MPLLDLAGEGLLMGGVLLVAKATLVMAGALAISRLLLADDPEARHALWSGTMVALLALPAISLAGGAGFGVPVPVPTSLGTESSVEATSPAMTDGAIPGAGGFMAEWEEAMTTTPLAVPQRPLRQDSRIPEASSPGSPALGSSAASPHAEGRAAGLLGLLWGLGALLSLGALVAGIGRTRRLIRRARPVESSDWEGQARSAARQVGLSHPVPLRMARSVDSAMAGGIVRPVVLLPLGARGWSVERRWIVLLHEFVHLKRRDPLRLLLERVVVALYWFHPLVRLVARECVVAREEACDRRVLQLGARPSKYATHLVELVDRRGPHTAGLTGFHHPDLEKRIMSILAPSRRSSRWPALTSGVLALTWFGAVALATPIATEGLQRPPLPAPAPAPAPELPREPTPPQATIEPVVAMDPGSPPPTVLGDTLETWGCRASPVDGEGARGYLLKGDVGKHALCLYSSGPVRLTEGGIRPGSLAPGAWVEIVVASPEGSQRLRIHSEAGGGLREEWFVNDDSRPTGPEVERWREALLAYLGATMERGRILGYEGRLRGQVAEMDGQRALLRGQIAFARGQVARLSGERSLALGTETRLRGEIARLRGETAQLRGQIARTVDPAELRALEGSLEVQSAHAVSRIAEIEDEIAALDTDARVADLDEELETLHGDTAQEITALKARLDALEGEHEARTRQLEDEIAALETESRIDEIDDRLPGLRVRALEVIEAVGFDGGSS